MGAGVPGQALFLKDAFAGHIQTPCASIVSFPYPPHFDLGFPTPGYQSKICVIFDKKPGSRS